MSYSTHSTRVQNFLAFRDMNFCGTYGSHSSRIDNYAPNTNELINSTNPKRIKLDENESRRIENFQAKQQTHNLNISKLEPNKVFIPEILVHIFGFLEAEPLDLCHCALVCRSWRANLWNSISTLVLDKPNTISKIKDEHIQFFAQTCPRLRHLNVLYCRNITDTGVKWISKMTNLEELLLSGCDKITDAGLVNLRSLSKLKQLYLSLCYRITDRGLYEITYLPSLEQLYLCGCDKLTDYGISRFIPRMHTLEELILSGCVRVGDGSCKTFSTLKNLKSVNLMCCAGITDTTLNHLSKVKSLEKLNLSGCVQITDTGIGAIMNLPNLQELNVMYCTRLTESCKQELRSKQSIKKLELT